ncbi:hypothetical protein CDAR_242631 [Caerostris darwini]|uniref:Secreted protein n=1 Tax=Caerostris darwini TaxID=1538125 RepID=A0AAV4N367_9ARAC|nr:hypothetical protein CDAR_242631 [Caerostris darwini]
MKTSCCFFFWPLPLLSGTPQTRPYGISAPFLLEMNNLPSLRLELPPEWVPRTVFRLERAVIPLLDARYSFERDFAVIRPMVSFRWVKLQGDGVSCFGLVKYINELICMYGKSKEV